MCVLYCCSVSESDEADNLTADLLAEASHTMYVKGRWVYTDKKPLHQYAIVQQSLPPDGDYSAHTQCCKCAGSVSTLLHRLYSWQYKCLNFSNALKNCDPLLSIFGMKNPLTVKRWSVYVLYVHSHACFCLSVLGSLHPQLGPGDRIQLTSPVYDVTAALQYTAQLVHVLAYILDVNLPHIVNYGYDGFLFCYYTCMCVFVLHMFVHNHIMTLNVLISILRNVC